MVSEEFEERETWRGRGGSVRAPGVGRVDPFRKKIWRTVRSDDVTLIGVDDSEMLERVAEAEPEVEAHHRLARGDKPGEEAARSAFFSTLLKIFFKIRAFAFAFRDKIPNLLSM